MRTLTSFTTGQRSKQVIEAYRGWLTRGARVLDVGCGDGILSEIVAKTFSLHITGCDIEQYTHGDFPFVQMLDRASLPFSAQVFDVVMFNDVLHHMDFPNQTQLLCDAFRVAKRVVVFEDEPGIVTRMIDWGINKFHSWRMPITFTFRTPAEWMQCFQELHLSYEYRQVRRPLLYPIAHEAFALRESASRRKSPS
jgi:ubiquinone/menaquinone biosynthesis C-methylase UbiE